MIPVLTPTESRALDAAASEPFDELVARAGWAVAVAARDLLGATYGRRVVVAAGPGANGADGRVAARWLRRWGARVDVVDGAALFADPPADLDVFADAVARADLVIDAVFGTGLRSPVTVPALPSELPVLAVDLPSGLDASTGEVWGTAWPAARTVTFAAAKPGLLQGLGPSLSGEVIVADIGLAADALAEQWWITADDVAQRWPARACDAHKWATAVACVGGEPGMAGGLELCARGAFAGGAGHVTIARPGGPLDAPVEAVHVDVGGSWVAALGDRLARVAALAIGPGTGPSSAEQIRAVVGSFEGPMVIDAGALGALADDAGRQLLVGRARLRPELPPPVLTPHDGEYAALIGERPGVDRAHAALRAAEHYAAVVLLKGPTTVVATPDGQLRYVTAGDERLATAGSGDVLTGLIAAALALGLDPLEASAMAATLHGDAARCGPRRGFTASLLPDLVVGWWGG